MLITCWSVKGGSGTTVTAVGLALVLARSHPAGVLLVDLAGDLPAAMGVSDPLDPGLTGWLAAGESVPGDALARLELDAGGGVALLPRGTGALDPVGDADVRLELLAGLLAAGPRPAVVDCGIVAAGSPVAGLVASGNHSLLVVRPCYLALRRVPGAGSKPSGVIVVSEPGRSMGSAEVEQVVGVPVVAEIPWDPSIARSVDAGLMSSRLPRSLDRPLARAFGSLVPDRAA